MVRTSVENPSKNRAEVMKNRSRIDLALRVLFLHRFSIDFGSENSEKIAPKADVFWQVSFDVVFGRQRFFRFFCSPHRCFCALCIFGPEPYVFVCFLM